MRLENLKKLVDLLDHYELDLILNDRKIFNEYINLLKKAKYDLEYSETEWSNK